MSDFKSDKKDHERSIRPLLIPMTVFFVLLVVLWVYNPKKKVKPQVRVQFIAADSAEQIEPIRDSLVVPVIYEKPLSFASLADKTKKEKFIDMILPSVLIARYHFDNYKKEIEVLQQKSVDSVAYTHADSILLDSLLSSFNAKDIIDLDKRLKTHPNSIILAQAAIESGWGTSRFFMEANNIFGIWSNDEEEKRMMASQTRGEQKIFVKQYDNLYGSIEDYLQVLAKTRAYRKFREVRYQSDNVYELIWYLKSYSERGDKYVSLLRDVIVNNNLTEYDHYRIDPEYIR